MGIVLTQPPGADRRASWVRLFAAAAWLAAGPVWAADATLEAAVWSKYLFRGQVFSDGPVFQPSLTLTAPAGFSFNTWLNVDLDDANASPDNDTRWYATEVDVTAAWTPTAAPAWLTPRVGATAYVVSEPREAAGSTAEIWAELRCDPSASDKGRGGIWPTLFGGVYGEVLEYDGAYACVGLEKNLSPAEPLTLFLAATIGYGGRRYNRFFFSLAGTESAETPTVDRGCWNDATARAELSWRIGPSVSVAAMGLYQVLVEDPVRAAARVKYGDYEWWVVGLKVVWAF